MGPEQVLVINPSNSITFEGTFKEIINKKITMKNPLTKNVAFKIKTTTPKQYCVRPSTGSIAPEEIKEISIMLQPLQYTLSEKAKHKFMIQSIVISDEDVSNIDLVWKNAPTGSIMCSKLLSVLTQTTETAQTKEKNNDQYDQMSDEVVTFNDLEEHVTEVEEDAVGDVPEDVDSTDTKETFSTAMSEILDENCKLKEQVSTLKNIVFENTYKWESMQNEGPQSDSAPLGVSYDSGPVQVGLPALVYQLIAFLLGLIIGKFIL